MCTSKQDQEKRSTYSWLMILIIILLAGQMLGIHITNIAAKINNKEVIYFNGNISYYNPAKDKFALLIGDSVPAENTYDCDVVNGSPYVQVSYRTWLYSHQANRVGINLTNQQYHEIYGMDHPCYEVSADK